MRAPNDPCVTFRGSQNFPLFYGVYKCVTLVTHKKSNKPLRTEKHTHATPAERHHRGRNTSGLYIGSQWSQGSLGSQRPVICACVDPIASVRLASVDPIASGRRAVGPSPLGSFAGNAEPRTLALPKKFSNRESKHV